jgi:hypothetical protein
MKNIPENYLFIERTIFLFPAYIYVGMGKEKRSNENQNENRYLPGGHSSFPVWIQPDHLQQLPYGHVENREASWLLDYRASGIRDA